jgi:hypothetical protein
MGKEDLIKNGQKTDQRAANQYTGEGAHSTADDLICQLLKARFWGGC